MLVFGCSCGPPLANLAGPAVGTVTLECIGQLPPSFIDFVITRRHADGVLLTGCRDGDCHFRLGIRWTRERLAGTRDPRLRQRVPRERLVSCWLGLDRQRALARELEAFCERLIRLGPFTRPQPATPVVAEQPSPESDA